MLEPEIFDFIPEGQAGGLLGRVVPRRPGGRQGPLRLRGRRLLGGRRAPSRPTSSPTRTSWTGKVQVDIDGLPAPPRGLAGQGGRDRPERGHRRPGGDRRQLRDRPRGPARARTAPSAATSASGTTPCSSVRSSTTTPTWARASGSTGSVLGSGIRPPPGRPVRGGGGARRRVLRRRPRRDQGRREGLPVQDGRGRGHRQLLDRVGVDGAPGRSSAGTACRAWPTSTSAPSWPSASRWPGPRPSRRGPRSPASRDTSRAARVLKRAIMVGCNAAGVNVDDLEAATVPVTRFQVTSLGQHGRGDRAAGPRRSPVGGAPLLRQGGHRRRRDHPAQDRAALPPRGLPPGAGPGDRRHRLPAPDPRALHRRP